MKRCPRGTHRNKKTGNCEPATKHAPKPKTPERKGKTPERKGKSERCPRGTRRNKKTGNCEASNAVQKEISKIAKIETQILSAEKKENESVDKIQSIHKKEEEALKRIMHHPIPNLSADLKSKLELFENKKKQHMFTSKIKDELKKVVNSISHRKTKRSQLKSELKTAYASISRKRNQKQHVKREIIEREIKRKQKIEREIERERKEIEDAQKEIEEIANNKRLEVERIHEEKEKRIAQHLKNCEIIKRAEQAQEQANKDYANKNKELELKQEQANKKYADEMKKAGLKQEQHEKDYDNQTILSVEKQKIRTPSQEELDELIMIHKKNYAHYNLKEGLKNNAIRGLIEHKYGKKRQQAFSSKIKGELKNISHNRTKRVLLREGIKHDIIVHNLTKSNIVIDHDKLQIENTKKKLQEIKQKNYDEQKRISDNIEKELESKNRELERQMNELEMSEHDKKSPLFYSAKNSPEFYSAKSNPSRSLSAIMKLYDAKKNKHSIKY